MVLNFHRMMLMLGVEKKTRKYKLDKAAQKSKKSLVKVNIDRSKKNSDNVNVKGTSSSKSDATAKAKATATAKAKAKATAKPKSTGKPKSKYSDGATINKPKSTNKPKPTGKIPKVGKRKFGESWVEKEADKLRRAKYRSSKPLGTSPEPRYEGYGKKESMGKFNR